jgi:putative membrane protein insertion efficiency factor
VTRTFWARVQAIPQRVLIALVQAYRLLLSPWLGSSCRFEPTCSRYALQALKDHGAAAGSYLTLRRLARCHPWCEGGCDAVPTQTPRLFARLGKAPGGHQPTPSTPDHPLP